MANAQKLIVFLTLLFISTFANAQMQRNRSDIFPKFGNHLNKGWVFSPGLTYMIPAVKDGNDRLWAGSDSVYDVLYDAKGRIGFTLEFGRFMAVESSKLISYIDFSVGGKIYRGEESYVATLDDADIAPEVELTNGGTFSESYLTANFNVTNTFSFSKEMAMHNTLGINADYKFASAYDYFDYDLGMDLQYPGDIVIQAHYKIGFGFKVSDNIFIVPSIETPIVTIHEYDDLKSSSALFNSRYRPIIMRLTVMILDNKKDRKCPTKNKKRNKSESLFGR